MNARPCSSGPLSRRRVRWVFLALLLTVELAHADVFRLIDDDRAAAQIRVDLIQQAQRELAIELYRASEDRMVLSYLALLRAAARRGVKVRFLIDGAFNQLSHPVQAHLVQEGVEIKEYHPLRLHKPRWFTRRLHDKMLLADRQQMLIGGRNFENPWFGIVEKSYVKRAYVDRDVYVRGDTAKDAHAYFMRLWQSKEVRNTALGIYDPVMAEQLCDPSWSEAEFRSCEDTRQTARAGLARAAAVIDQHWTQLKAGEFVHINPGADWSSGQADVAEVRFLHDPVARKGKDPGTFQAFLRYVHNAQQSVLIETPYFVLSDNSLKAFQGAVARGAKVRILTNSLAATQNFYAQAAYERKKARWVQMGFELWEYKGPKMLHAKSVVIDDRIAIVGNFNVDPRSESLNTELAVAAHDRLSAQQLRMSIEAHLRNAWRVAADGMPDGESERFPGVSGGRILKLRLYQLFVPLIEKQL